MIIAERDAENGVNAQPQQYFHRFLDLPPELRARILSYVVTRAEPCKARRIVAPLITAASQQLRAEAFPIFFAENTFTVYVRTNFRLLDEIDAVRQNEPRLGPVKEEAKGRVARRRIFATTPQPPYWPRHALAKEANKSGYIGGMNRVTKTWLRELDDVVIFRKLEFMTGSSTLASAEKWEEVYPGRGFLDCCDGVVTVQMSSASAQAVQVHGQALNAELPQRTWLDKFDRMMVEFNAAVTDIKTREGFRGFSLQDVEALALAFRYWPED